VNSVRDIWDTIERTAMEERLRPLLVDIKAVVAGDRTNRFFEAANDCGIDTGKLASLLRAVERRDDVMLKYHVLVGGLSGIDAGLMEDVVDAYAL